MSEESLVDQLDKLKAAVDAVEEAIDQAEDIADLSDELLDLNRRIDEAREDPDSLDPDVYADLALDIMLVIPNDLPLPEAAKKTLELVASALTSFIQGAQGLALTLLARRFRDLLKTGMSPQEAAKNATLLKPEQGWLLTQYRLGKVTAAGDTRETKGAVEYLWGKFKGVFSIWSPLVVGPLLVLLLAAFVFVLLGPLGLFSSDDAVADANQPLEDVPTAAATEADAVATSTPNDATPAGPSGVIGCGGIGSDEYFPVPATEQFVLGAVPINDRFSFAAVDGGISFCLEIPEEAGHEAVVAGGGYFQSTLSMTLNDLLVELTVSDGDGLGAFGRVIRRVGAIEEARFPLEGARIVDGVVIIFVPAERQGGGLTFLLGGGSYSELSFIGIGAGTWSEPDALEPVWVGTAAGDFAAFDAAVSWP